MAARAHDDRLLDALSAIAPAAYSGTFWRVARKGRSPLDGSRGAGRWNPAELCVLYCAEAADGALSEIRFHLSRGQPVFPSRMDHLLHEMRATLAGALKLLDLDQLPTLGVEAARWRDLLNDRTQAIGAAAAFLGFDGLIAPSARHDCANVVIFLDSIAPGAIAEVSNAPVDWPSWIGRRP